jgi:uncharacterized protein
MDDLVAAVARALEGHEEVISAWVYGSVARGKARANSDLDVAVLLGLPPGRRLSFDELPLDILRDLEHATGREVDLVVIDTADVDLVHRVLRDGVLVCDRDRSRRIAFEVQKRHEYFDIAPRREAYRRAQIARAREGRGGDGHE